MSKVVKKAMAELNACKLRRSLPFIEEQVEANDILSHLYAGGIIDANDKEAVSKTVTRKERASCLVTLLMNRGDRAYGCFLDALRKENYEDVVERITGQPPEYKGYVDMDAAGPAHVDLVTVPLEAKVANLEDQAIIHDRKLERISRRLDDAVTKDDLKIIQKEIQNLTAATEKEKEIKNLKSQLRMKEAELASLTEKSAAQVQQLMSEIASLKEKAEKGEKELQQYMIEKDKLEHKVQDLISSEVLNKQEIENIKEDAKTHQEKLKKMEEDHKQKDHAVNEHIKDLLSFKDQILGWGQIMPQAPIALDDQPTEPREKSAESKVHNTERKNSRTHLPTTEYVITSPGVNIKGANSHRQPPSTTARHDPAGSKASNTKNPRKEVAKKKLIVQPSESEDSKQGDNSSKIWKY